jgi:hypothetical protein
MLNRSLDPCMVRLCVCVAREELARHVGADVRGIDGVGVVHVDLDRRRPSLQADDVRPPAGRLEVGAVQHVPGDIHVVGVNAVGHVRVEDGAHVQLAVVPLNLSHL